MSSYSDSRPPISFLVHGLTLHSCFTLERLLPHGVPVAPLSELPPLAFLRSEVLPSRPYPTPDFHHSVGLCWQLRRSALLIHSRGSELYSHLHLLYCWQSANPTEYQTFDCDFQNLFYWYCIDIQKTWFLILFGYASVWEFTKYMYYVTMCHYTKH